LLKHLSDTTGLQIITNTGYYAARNFVYLPPQFYTQTAEQVASTWIKEFQEGIEGTRIRPGFIKIGVDSKDQLTAADIKLVEAAGLTHLATGLTIVAHTGDDTTAVQELAILEDLDVAPDAFVWTHAQNGTSQGHLRLAREGTWISLDGMGWIEPDSVSKDSSGINQYVNFLVNLKQAGLLDRTLISHDAGWYTAGASDQSGYKGYTGIFKWIIPALYKAGFTAADMEKLLIDNPKEAYAIRVRHR
jgi:phosphotriesterase-related protein